MNTHNVKQAQMILAHRVKKAKERARKQEMEKIQLATQGNIEAGQAAEQARQQTLMLESEFELRKLEMEKQYELQAKELELNKQMEMRLREKELEMNYKLIIARETNDTKVEVQEIANEGRLQTSNSN
jgi:hypothetical protein